MTLRIMMLDMIKVRRFAERRDFPIESSEPLMQMRISTSNISNVAFEVLHVYHIEPHDRGIQPDIRFGETVTEQILS